MESAGRATRIVTVARETAIARLKDKGACLHPMLQNSLILPLPTLLDTPRKPVPANLFEELLGTEDLPPLPSAMCMVIVKQPDQVLDSRSVLDRVLTATCRRVHQRGLTSKDVTCSTITKNDGSYLASLNVKIVSLSATGHGPKAEDAQRRACESMLALLDDEPVAENVCRVVFSEEVEEAPSIPTHSNATSLMKFLAEQSKEALRLDASAPTAILSKDAQIHIMCDNPEAPWRTVYMSRPSSWTDFEGLHRTFRRIDKIQIVAAPEDNQLGQRPFTPAEVSGKCVVITRGTWEPNQRGSYNAKCNHAAEGGALAVIMINSADGLFDVKARMGYVSPSLPCICISKNCGEELLAKLKANPSHPLLVTKAERGVHLVEQLSKKSDGTYTCGITQQALKGEGAFFFELVVEMLDDLDFFPGLAKVEFTRNCANAKVGDENSYAINGFAKKLYLNGSTQDIEKRWDESLENGNFTLGFFVDFALCRVDVLLNGVHCADFSIPPDQFIVPAVTMKGTARFRVAPPFLFPPAEDKVFQPWAQQLHTRPVRTYERPAVEPVKAKPSTRERSGARHDSPRNREKKRSTSRNRSERKRSERRRSEKKRSRSRRRSRKRSRSAGEERKKRDRSSRRDRDRDASRDRDREKSAKRGKSRKKDDDKDRDKSSLRKSHKKDDKEDRDKSEIPVRKARKEEDKDKSESAGRGGSRSDGERKKEKKEKKDRKEDRGDRDRDRDRGKEEKERERSRDRSPSERKEKKEKKRDKSRSRERDRDRSRSRRRERRR